VLGSLLSEINARTMRSIANDEQFSGLVQANFQRIRQYMGKYPEVMPQVVYMVGAGNPVLGDWIVQEFLKSAGAEVEARIVNQIIVSTPGRTFPRLALFLESLLEKMMISSKESEI
jgi:predicted NBD/HSP70 family sugar kinase